MRSKCTLHYSINIFVWGVALCSHAACKSFGGLFAVRLILGMCEGSITAGFMIVSSMFYTRKELATRVSIFYTGNMMASSFSGLIAAGIFAGLDGTHNLAGWQW